MKDDTPVKDKKKLFAFYEIAGVMLLIAGSCGIIIHVNSGDDVTKAVVGVIMFALGAIFLHRASKINLKNEEI